MKHFFIAICLIFVATIATAQEEDDRSWLIRFLEDNLSEEGTRDVRIEGFSGALSSTARIERLTVSDPDGIWLIIENAELSWTRRALLSGAVDINRLAAERIILERLPVAEAAATSPEATPFALPELPVSIQIAALDVARVELGAAILGFPVIAQTEGSMSLAGGEGSAILNLTRLDGPEGIFALDSSYSNVSGVLDLGLQLTESPGGIAVTLLSIPGEPSLDLNIAGTGPLSDFTGEIALASDGTPRVTGSVVMGMSEQDEQQISVDLAGDVARLLLPEYQPFFGDNVVFAAQVRRSPDGTTVLDGLDLRTASLAIAGSAVIDAGGVPELFALTIDMQSDGATPVRLPVPGRVEAAAANLVLNYDRAEGAAWNGQARLQELRVDDLRLGLAELDLNGTIDAQGNTLAGVTADVASAFQGLEFADAGLQAAIGSAGRAAFSVVWAVGDPVRIDDITLSTQNAELRGDVTVNSGDGTLTLTTDLQAMLPDLRAFSALATIDDLAGAVTLDLDGDVELLSGAFDLNIVTLAQDIGLGVGEPEGILAGETRMTAHAIRDTNGLRLDAFDIAGMEVSAEGRAVLSSARSSLEVSVGLRDAALVMPDLSGPVTADLQMSRSSADLPWTVIASGELQETIQIALEGTVDPAQATFDLALEATGQDVVLGVGEPAGILAGRTEISAHVINTVDGLQVEAFDIAGTQITAAGTAMISDATSAVDLTARLRNAGILTSTLSGPITLDLAMTRASADRPWNVQASGVGQGGLSADVSGQVGMPNGAVNLSVQGSVPLALVNQFIEPRSVQGTARLDLNVTGALSLNAVGGTITADGVRVSAPNLGLALEGASLNVRLNGGRADVSVDGTLAAGGNVSLNGNVDLAGAGLPGSFDILLTGARISRDDFLQTVVERGTITLAGRMTQGPSVSGEIILGQTDIQISANSAGAAEPIPEIIHIGESAGQRRTRDFAGLLRTTSGPSGPPISIDLNIIAANRIFLRGSGLDAELGGAIRIGGNSNNVIPSGQFDLIRGRLSLLGQRFDLVEGSVTMSGSFNPYLRLVAESQAGDVLVLITVEGPADAPELTFSSSPSLPQDEILAQLLFGRGVSNLSAVQALQLVDGVSRLAGGGSIIGGLRRNLGIDNLDLTTDEAGNSEVRVGRYIGENAYTDVGVGSDGDAEVTLNLDLTPNLTARGSFSSDGQSGLGLFFERDY